jgi:hypothetical protein
MSRIRALALCATLAACGATPRAPTTVRDPAFAATRIRTITLAPYDLDVTVGSGAAALPAQVRGDAIAQLANTTIDSLEQRGYTVTSVVSSTDARARIVQRTGADATLFVRGRSFVPAPRPASDHLGNRIGDAIARTVVSTAATTINVAAETQLGHDCHHHVWHWYACECRSPEDLIVAIGPGPDVHGVPDTASAQLDLAMVLVDNTTGHVLWQSSTQSTTNAAKAAEVGRAAKHLLAGLPAAR